MIQLPSKIIGLYVKELMNTKIADIEYQLTEKEKMDFLMHQACQKNILIEKYIGIIGNQRRLLVEKSMKKTVQEMVSEVLLKIDEDKSSYDDLEDISYEHLKAVYEVSKDVDNGDEICRKILETLYKGIIATMPKAEVEVIYDERVHGTIEGVQRMSITTMASREENFEEIMRALNEADYTGLANIYYAEIQRL